MSHKILRRGYGMECFSTLFATRTPFMWGLGAIGNINSTSYVSDTVLSALPHKENNLLFYRCRNWGIERLSALLCGTATKREVWGWWLSSAGFVLRKWKCSKIDGGDGCTALNILRTIKSDTLNEWIVWCVNCISLKLF